VKKLVINPHKRISLQYHNYRDERWIIARGSAFITIGTTSRVYETGEVARISKKEIHRIENKTDSEVVIIEVQIGEYLGEDDIFRIEDDFSR